jgi:nucleoside-diphosphate-sugar epimerase
MSTYAAVPTGEGAGLRALVTGLRGFTGHYVAQELAAAGYEVHGTAHDAGAGADPHIHLADLCDRARVAEVVEQVRPDVVVHLAAIAFVAHSDVEAIYRTNIAGTRNLLEALAACAHKPRAVLLASSANIYGNSLQLPITEDTPAAPANDYAVSKLAMEYMARLWLDRLPIVFARPFNYTGVGQTDNFLLPKIVSHYRRRAAVIELGNLDVARDFSDVRTVASAYRRLLALAPAGGVFNVCSGEAHTLRQVLDMLADICGYAIEVRVNPAFVRANEVRTLVGSAARLEQAVGALPAVPLADTLRWMVQA